MRKVEKLESVTCDYCAKDVGEDGLNAGKLLLDVGADLLEIRLVKQSDKRPGQTVTQVKKDVCKECWMGMITGKEGAT